MEKGKASVCFQWNALVNLAEGQAPCSARCITFLRIEVECVLNVCCIQWMWGTFQYNSHPMYYRPQFTHWMWVVFKVNWIGVHWMSVLNWCPLNTTHILYTHSMDTNSVHLWTNTTHIQYTHSMDTNSVHIQIQLTFKWNTDLPNELYLERGIYELVSTWMWVVLKVTQSTNQVTFLMLAFPQLRSWGFDTGGQAGPKPDQLEKKIFELASSNQICDERESNPSRAEVAPGRGSLVILILSWRWIGAVRPHLGVD